MPSSSSKEKNNYTFTVQNHLGIPTDINQLTLEHVPALNLTLATKDKQLFYPYKPCIAEIKLRNGKTIQVSSATKNQQFVEAFTDYFNMKAVAMQGYRPYECKNGVWNMSDTPKKEPVSGLSLSIKPEKIGEIETVTLRSPVSAIVGETWVISPPSIRSQSSSAPALASR